MCSKFSIRSIPICLRYCTAWTEAEAGEMFEVPAKISPGGWQSVVDALVSNTAERTDRVVLVFERPLD